MHLGVAVLKLMSNESESAKKICTFLDYLTILEAGASASAVVGLRSISTKKYFSLVLSTYVISVRYIYTKDYPR